METTGTIIYNKLPYVSLSIMFFSKLGYIQVSVANLRKTADCIGHSRQFSQNMSRDILISFQNGINIFTQYVYTQTFKGPSEAILIFISNQPLLVSNKITQISHVIN